MDKLGEHVPEPDVTRIYRLRTNDEAYTIIYEFECLNWEENFDNIIRVWADRENDPKEMIYEQIQDDKWIWTVEYPDEEAAQEEVEETQGIANDKLDSPDI